MRWQFGWRMDRPIFGQNGVVKMTATTSTKSKTSKIAKHDPDAVSTVLLERVVTVAGTTLAAEIGLLHEFAAAMSAETLSVRGFRATLAAATERGSELAYLKPKHGDHLPLMSSILKTDGANQSIAEANTLADRLIRIQPTVKGTPKTVSAANVLAGAVKKGKTYAAIKKATDDKFRKTPAKTRTARPKTDAPEPSTAGTPDVAGMSAWVAGLSFDDLTADLQAALLTLADAIHDKIDELAE